MSNTTEDRMKYLTEQERQYLEILEREYYSGELMDWRVQCRMMDLQDKAKGLQV